MTDKPNIFPLIILGVVVFWLLIGFAFYCME